MTYGSSHATNRNPVVLRSTYALSLIPKGTAVATGYFEQYPHRLADAWGAHDLVIIIHKHPDTRGTVVHGDQSVLLHFDHLVIRILGLWE